jgi:hypothetical protein
MSGRFIVLIIDGAAAAIWCIGFIAARAGWGKSFPSVDLLLVFRTRNKGQTPASASGKLVVKANGVDQ